MSQQPQSNEPLYTEEVKAAMESFVEQVNPMVLYKGLRHLLLHYLREEDDREIWLDPFLLEYSTLCELLDELRRVINS
jgi:hypothetical protein